MKEEKPIQEKIVYDIMSIICPARTELIKIAAMRRGVSCADRHMRFLSDRGIVINVKKAKSDDSTDTWEVVAPYTPKKIGPKYQADLGLVL
ncbi:hypothetical protein FP828_03690 [bacterium]|nr:hypothetical protein [Candidatus Omnitrophota bacterium]MBA3065575.1 hypothetical protein [bacterium]